MDEEKLLLGTMRPPFEGWLLHPGGYILCSCGATLTHQQATFSHWQLGHFDYPVYCTKQEAIDRMIEKGLI